MRIHATFKIEHIDARFCVSLWRGEFSFRLRSFGVLLMFFLLGF
ncbi:Uncharacterised protein [Enterobacter cloacae]|nr:Uncharacterised protein [Enterobacter cloacae]